MVFSRLALEKYSIQSNNDNAKPSPVSALKNLKIWRSSESTRKNIELSLRKLAALKNPIRQYKIQIFILSKRNIAPVTVKQTKGKEASQEILLPYKKHLFQLNKCEDIDVEKIQNVAIKTQGGAGPLGMDLDGWKSILTSKQFG